MTTSASGERVSFEAIITRNEGANLANSAFQFPTSDAGTTINDGRRFPFTATSSAITCKVLPKPMSSAKQAPRPRRCMNSNHAKPFA